jgi:N-acyl-D-aspartate/D-glutamate deacylase
VDLWGKADSVLNIMREARARGCKVVGDQYPWTASGTGLSASLVPRWAEAGGRDSLRARAADPAPRARMLADMRENLRRRGGDSTLLLIDGNADAAPYIGKTLKQVADAAGTPAVETALDLVLRGIDMGVASFNMTEADIERFMRDEFIMTSSDGSDGHPRLYATYPRKIRRYVLDKPVITMERMVASASGQVAATYGLADRGELRAGAFADVLVFDPNAFREEATFTKPRTLASGMEWVIVNGVPAVQEGKATNALAGRVLRKR